MNSCNQEKRSLLEATWDRSPRMLTDDKIVKL
jgi:hypothetical protein